MHRCCVNNCARFQILLWRLEIWIDLQKYFKFYKNINRHFCGRIERFEVYCKQLKLILVPASLQPAMPFAEVELHT